MTPQGKAKELIDSFRQYAYDGSFHNEKIELTSAKHCALIAVNEILRNAENYSEWKGSEFKELNQYKYWQQVKEELGKVEYKQTL